MNFKKKFLKIFSLILPFENDNNPFPKLLINYKEIQTLCQDQKEKFMEFLYFNKIRVHEILYDEEEVFKINSNGDIKLSNIYYLSLLIVAFPETIDYSYSIDYIRAVHKKVVEVSCEKKIRKIIIAKIIICLIYNFKGEDEYNEEEYDEEIEEIENKNKEIIKENLDALNELNLNYDLEKILEMKIDYLYKEIIVALIENNKFNDYSFCIDIIQQLDLENIHINNIIFNGISDILNNKIKDVYSLESIKDLTDESKINFYYILIIFVLKNSLYNYQNKFLYSNIRNIIKKLKSNNLSQNELSLIKQNKNENNRKIEEILKQISNKYYNIYINKTKKKKGEMNAVYLSNKNSQEEENENEESEIIQIDKIEYDKAVEILTELTFDIHIIIKKNKTDPIFYYKNIKYGKHNKKMEDIDDLKIHADYENITDDDKKYNKDAEIVYKNYRKLAYFLEEVEDYIKQSGIKFNPRINLQIKKENRDINKEGQNPPIEFRDIYNLTCISSFYNQRQNENLTFKDENILVHSINGKSQGIINLMNELTNDDYNDEIFSYTD